MLHKLIRIGKDVVLIHVYHVYTTIHGCSLLQYSMFMNADWLVETDCVQLKLHVYSSNAMIFNALTQ